MKDPVPSSCLITWSFKDLHNLYYISSVGVTIVITGFVDTSAVVCHASQWWMNKWMECVI